MIDWFLCIAYRVAPEPFAQRISEVISRRRCVHRWAATVAAHKAAGGMVVTHAWAGGETSTLVGGDA